MKENLYFQQSINSAYEIARNLLEFNGEIKTQNAAAKILNGNIIRDSKTCNIQLKVITKLNKNLLIFHSENDIGDEFYKSLEEQIRKQDETYILELTRMEDERNQNESGTKECPFCAETIQFKAIKCRYCGERLNEKIVNSPPSQIHRSSLAALNKKIKENYNDNNYKKIPPAPVNEKVIQADNSVTYFGKKFSAKAQIILFFGIMGLFVAGTVFIEEDNTGNKNEMRNYTSEKFKSTIGYSKTLMRYTHGDLKMLINYWGMPDEAFETSESDIGYYKRILRCSWSNVRVDGKEVQINFVVPDYYELINVSDFTNGNINMELADAAEVFSYQSKR